MRMATRWYLWLAQQLLELEEKLCMWACARKMPAKMHAHKELSKWGTIVLEHIRNTGPIRERKMCEVTRTIGRQVISRMVERHTRKHALVGCCTSWWYTGVLNLLQKVCILDGMHVQQKQVIMRSREVCVYALAITRRMYCVLWESCYCARISWLTERCFILSLNTNIW